MRTALNLPRRRGPLLPLAGEGKDEGASASAARRLKIHAPHPLTPTLSRKREREKSAPWA
jgi:hypothetical protein